MVNNHLEDNVCKSASVSSLCSKFAASDLVCNYILLVATQN